MNRLTTRGLLSAVTILTLISCNDRATKTTQFDIKGSWYTDLGNGGLFDSLINYGEIYITDTTFEYQDETAGQLPPQRYYIKGDSIFKCWTVDANCDFIHMFKINKLDKDTLWLSINSDFVGKSKKQESFFVRLPKNEKGYYDHKWTNENSDSLRHAVVNDYHRRMWKYHCYRLDEMDHYDSLVKSGNWDWSMKQVREAERKEKEYLDRMKNGS